MKRWLSADRAFVGAYGFAHFGKSLFWQSGEILFVFFLTEICAIPPLQTGVLLGAALLFSAVADLVVAQRLGRWMASPAGAARLQLVGTALCALALLLFSWTPLVPTDGRFVFALGASLLFRLAYALIDVPQNAILGLATRSDAERVGLSAVRYVVGGAAAICISGLVVLLIRTAKAADPLLAVSLPVTAIGAIAILGSALNLLVMRRRQGPQGAEAATGAILDFKASVAVHPVRWLILMAVATAATTPVFSKLEPYFAAYAIGSAAAGGLIVAATSLGGVLTQPFWIALAHRLPRRRTIEIAAATLIAGALAFLLLGARGAPWAAACGFVFGAGLGGLGMALWASLADASARPTPTGATPSAAAIFAGFTFATKTALAGSIALVTAMLSVHDYRTPASGEAWPLSAVMCLAPAAGAMICILAARFLSTPAPASDAPRRSRPRPQPAAH